MNMLMVHEQQSVIFAVESCGFGICGRIFGYMTESGLDGRHRSCVETVSVVALSEAATRAES